MRKVEVAERSLVTHLAMWRTLFVFPREILGIAQAGASRGVAHAERRRLVREFEKAGLHGDGERWLTAASRQVLAFLSDGREARHRSSGTRSRWSWALSPAARGSRWGGRCRSVPGC